MRRLVFYVAAIFFTTPLPAQIKYGVKAGFNVSRFIIVRNVHNDFKVGGNTGFFCFKPIDNKFRVQAEFIYSSKGSRLPGKNNSKLHYLNLPLMVGYSPINKITLLCGPEVGLLAAYNTPYPYRKTDFSVVAGVAYSMCGKIGVEARYDHGISKLIKGLVVGQYGDVEGYKYYGSNRTFQLGICYLLDFKN